MSMTLPFMTWETPTILFDEYTFLQATAASDTVQVALNSATSRMGHYGITLPENLRQNFAQFRFIFWQKGSALFHDTFTYEQACESVIRELGAVRMQVLFRTKSYMFCWMVTTTFCGLDQATFPRTTFHITDGRMSTVFPKGIDTHNATQWGIFAMAGWNLSTDLMSVAQDQIKMQLSPTQHGLISGTNDMANCITAYHFSHVLDDMISLHSAPADQEARTVYTVIDYHGLVIFEG